MNHSSAELTIDAVADFLNVGCSYVMRLIEDGIIPSHAVSSSRCVKTQDVVVYHQKYKRERGAALDRLSALDQQLGLV